MSRTHYLRMAALTAILLASGSAWAATTAAGSFPTTPPTPGPAPQLTVPTPTAQTLPNGLEVISVRRAGLPLVTARWPMRCSAVRTRRA